MNFTLRNKKNVLKNIKLSYNTLLEFNRDSDLNYNTMYGIIRGKKTQRDKAILFFKSYNSKVDNNATLSKIFSLE